MAPKPIERCRLEVPNDQAVIASAIDSAKRATHAMLRRLAIPATHTTVEVPLELFPAVRKLIGAAGERVLAE